MTSLIGPTDVPLLARRCGALGCTQCVRTRCPRTDDRVLMIIVSSAACTLPCARRPAPPVAARDVRPGGFANVLALELPPAPVRGDGPRRHRGRRDGAIRLLRNADPGPAVLGRERCPRPGPTAFFGFCRVKPVLAGRLLRRGLLDLVCVGGCTSELESDAGRAVSVGAAVDRGGRRG